MSWTYEGVQYAGVTLRDVGRYELSRRGALFRIVRGDRWRVGSFVSGGPCRGSTHCLRRGRATRRARSAVAGTYA